jgi:hypothetical protein
MKRIITYSLLFFLFSCESDEIHKFKGKNYSKNFSLYSGTFFKDETITIKFNDEIIFNHKMDSTFQCYRIFQIPYTDSFKISIKTKYDNKFYIDTSFEGIKSTFGYILNISRPLPFNWKEYFVQGQPEAVSSWGYLPIDSCIRFTTFLPDTLNKGLWTDIVN